MKNIYITIFSVLAIFSCNDFDLADQGFVLQNIEGSYIAFNQAGSEATPVVENVSEGETVAFELEAPVGISSDVTVNFTFGGDATYGVDFTMAGATAAGGSIVIPNNVSNVNEFDMVEFSIVTLTDLTQDGSKIVTVDLVSATGADGTVYVVGRGDFLKTGTINIADADCGLLAGVYNVLGTILVDDFGSGPYTITEAIALADCSVEGTYGVKDITGGLYANAYATSYGVSAAAASLVIDAANAVTWTGVSDQFGGSVLEDPAAATTSNYNPATKVITVYWTATAYGERGISTYTLP